MKSGKLINNKFLKSGSGSFTTSVVAFLLAIVVGGILIELAGFSSIATYGAIFRGSLGSSRGLVLSLSQATPLLLTGLSFAIAFRVRIINTGAEGQVYIGAMAAALVGAYVNFLPGITHVAVAVLVGMIAGGLVGLFIGFLKIKFGASEVIVGIMLNEILILITAWLSTGPLMTPGSATAQTNPILETARLGRLVPRSQLTWALVLAVIIAVYLEWMIRKTTLGYEIQVIGSNLKAAKTAGINVPKIYLLTIFISGAIAGLGGAALSLGIHYRFIEGISTGFGFAGIPVAALAMYSPAGVVVSSFLFGALRAGAMTLNRTTSIPIEFVSVVQALVVVFVAAPMLIASIKKNLMRPFRGIKNKRESLKGGDA